MLLTLLHQKKNNNVEMKSIFGVFISASEEATNSPQISIKYIIFFELVDIKANTVFQYTVAMHLI